MDKKSAIEYEFSDQQSAVVERLAGAMRFVGIACLSLGALGAIADLFLLASSPYSALAFAPAVVAAVAQGLWLLSAAASFMRVVNTSGNDIGGLLSAAADLRKYYVVMAVTAGFLLVSATVALVFGPP